MRFKTHHHPFCPDLRVMTSTTWKCDFIYQRLCIIKARSPKYPDAYIIVEASQKHVQSWCCCGCMCACCWLRLCRKPPLGGLQGGRGKGQERKKESEHREKRERLYVCRRLVYHGSPGDKYSHSPRPLMHVQRG